MVRFRDTGKGYGFVVPDEGGRDVYLRVSMRNRGPSRGGGEEGGRAGSGMTRGLAVRAPF